MKFKYQVMNWSELTYLPFIRNYFLIDLLDILSIIVRILQLSIRCAESIRSSHIIFNKRNGQIGQRFLVKNK